MSVQLTRAELERAVALAREYKRRVPWLPLPGPQTMAYESLADIVGFGGSAGGGKTDLACGKALTKQRKAMMLRRVGTELTGIEDRLEELIGSKQGYNGQKKIWKHKLFNGTSLQIEFASLPNLGDERGYQGRPHDFLVFDEAANFLEAQVRFLLGWLRTTISGQHCQALMTFNPPTSAEGRWIIDFFGPWLDTKHPLYPTAAGELRYAAMLPTPDGSSKDVWLDGDDKPLDGRPFVLVGDVVTYDFDPKKHEVHEIIRPQSRTFIPSRISDNPHLMGTGYMAQLQALPEPLRSQMLLGDFQAGMEDDPWQVIPTDWVDKAMARWKPLDSKPPMDSLGVDVARGGKDQTVIARRHGGWYDELVAYPGTETPNGPATAGLVMAQGRDRAPIHIDVIGVGSSPYDFLVEAKQQVLGINVSEKALGTDKSGMLRFLNMRSELWWNLREALDPQNNEAIALPPDQRLRADLCAPKWKLQGPIIVVESREEIVKRIGRSPDYASAIILAQIDTPKIDQFARTHNRGGEREYDPYRRGDHDPYN